MPDHKFYVYVLFDADAVPRYVGKGQGNRLSSTTKTERRNPMKRAFLRETIERLGEVPAVIIRSNLSEDEAFIIERAFIKAIGRRGKKTGPLTNISEGGDGPTSAEIKAAHAAMTPMDKWLWKKSISDSHLKHAPEIRSSRARLREQSRGEEKRKASGRKTSATLMRHSESDRKAKATKASLSVKRILWINDGKTDRRIEPTDDIPSGWKAGRFNISNVRQLSQSTIGTKWATNGTESIRLKSNESLPDGWIYGRKLKIDVSSIDHCISSNESATQTSGPALPSETSAI